MKTKSTQFLCFIDVEGSPHIVNLAKISEFDQCGGEHSGTRTLVRLDLSLPADSGPTALVIKAPISIVMRILKGDEKLGRDYGIEII